MHIPVQKQTRRCGERESREKDDSQGNERESRAVEVGPPWRERCDTVKTRKTALKDRHWLPMEKAVAKKNRQI